MSLTQDSYTFTGTSHLKHGLVIPEGDWDMGVEIGQFQGVVGESHLIDERKGRNLFCRAMLFGYSSLSELESAISEIRGKKGKLTGKLTQNADSNDRDFDDCTFMAFETNREAFKDGKANGDNWCITGVLRWRQRKGN